jgi:hypothetical protein
MNTPDVAKPVDKGTLLCRLWVGLNWQKRLQPAGGTRPRGSAHPKGGHEPVVCAAVRLNPRVVSYEVPLPFAKPKPFRSFMPKIGRNQPCPCGTTDKCGRSVKFKRCHGVAVPCAL